MKEQAVEAVESRAPDQTVPPGPVVSTRVDPPHRLATESRQPTFEATASTGANGEGPPSDPGSALPTHVARAFADPRRVAWAFSQLRSHAEQLSAHLRQVQDDVDRREALLNARQARLDEAERTLRLWADERQSDLAAREAQLGATEQAGLLPMDPSPSRFDAEDSSELRSRLAHVARAEQTHRECEAILTEQRRQLDEDRRKFEAWMTVERQRLAEESAQVTAAREALAAVEEEQTRRLEARRLAIEEVWLESMERLQASLAGQLDVAEVRAASGACDSNSCETSTHTRSQLAGEFELYAARLNDRRREMLAAAGELGDRMRFLETRRDELLAWYASRQAELAEKESELNLRNRRMTEREAALADRRRTWSEERADLLRQIRDLSAQLAEGCSHEAG